MSVKFGKFFSEALISAWRSFTYRKSTARDLRLYFPSEGSHNEDFYALKNPSTPAGFETANLRSRPKLSSEYSMEVMPSPNSTATCLMLMWGLSRNKHNLDAHQQPAWPLVHRLVVEFRASPVSQQCTGRLGAKANDATSGKPLLIQSSCSRKISASFTNYSNHRYIFVVPVHLRYLTVEWRPDTRELCF